MQVESVEVRQLGDEEYEQLAQAARWLFGWHLTAEPGSMLVAIRACRMIGYLQVHGEAITCMEVAEHHWGSGVGRALVATLQASHTRLAAYGVEFDAEGFWSALGFREDTSGDDPTWRWHAPDAAPDGGPTISTLKGTP